MIRRANLPRGRGVVIIRHAGDERPADTALVEDGGELLLTLDGGGELDLLTEDGTA